MQCIKQPLLRKIDALRNTHNIHTQIITRNESIHPFHLMVFLISFLILFRSFFFSVFCFVLCLIFFSYKSYLCLNESVNCFFFSLSIYHTHSHINSVLLSTKNTHTHTKPCVKKFC